MEMSIVMQKVSTSWCPGLLTLLHQKKFACALLRQLLRTNVSLCHGSRRAGILTVISLDFFLLEKTGSMPWQCLGLFDSPSRRKGRASAQNNYTYNIYISTPRIKLFGYLSSKIIYLQTVNARDPKSRLTWLELRDSIVVEDCNFLFFSFHFDVIWISWSTCILYIEICGCGEGGVSHSGIQEYWKLRALVQRVTSF